MDNARTVRIKFHFLTGGFQLEDRNRLKAFLLKKLKGEGKSVEAINYIFCDDRYLLQMNREYLKHDTYTDIITFELSPRSQPLLSDIYISVERVRENASSYHSSFKRELHRVIFHGALHLAGFKDKSAADSARMREMEERFLDEYLVPRGTPRAKD